MKKILLPIIVFLINQANAQNLQWAKSFGGTDIDAAAAFTTDGNGNVITCGGFSATVDFNPGTSVFNLTAVGNSDIYIQKLDAGGNFVWAKQIGGLVSGEEVVDITTNVAGEIFVFGNFSDVVDFDPGAATSNVTAVGVDCFVLKLDATGNFDWVKTFGGFNSSCYASSIKLEINGNILLSGNFNNAIDLDPGIGVQNATSFGDRDMYILKLTSTGNFVWGKNMGGSGIDKSIIINSDASGNVFTTGYFRDTADFNPQGGGNSIISAGGQDIFITKHDAAGNFLWAKSISGISLEQANSMSLDANGNIYLSGIFYDPTDFDPGTPVYNLISNGDREIFICKLDAAGNFVWAKQIGGSAGDTQREMDVDANGNIVCSGFANGVIDLDPGAGIQLTNASLGSEFVVYLNSTGNFLSYHQFGTAANAPFITDILLNNSGQLLITGEYSGTVDFDPGTGTFNITANAPYTDVFVLKLSNITGLDHLNAQVNFSIFPNPANQSTTISNLPMNENCELKIIDVMGKVVYQSLVIPPQSLIDVSEFENGIYFIQITSKNKSTSQKLIVQH